MKNTKLKIIILESGMTQRAIAKALNVHEQSVSCVIRGVYKSRRMERRITELCKSVSK